MDDMPLPVLFEQARKIHSVASESSVDQETLKRGIEALRRCAEMVTKLGLFPSNETKEDVSTTSLKYLLVQFYIAELIDKVIDDDRFKNLKLSQDHLEEFLSMCGALELLPKEELEFSSIGPTDFAARRTNKIARFKRQEAAKKNLLEIKERKERRGRSLRAEALSTPVEAGQEDSQDDGEVEREEWLTAISIAICKGYNLMDMLNREEEMLLIAKERRQ